MNVINEWLIELFLKGINSSLKGFVSIFEASVSVLKEKVGLIPGDFSVLTTLRSLSDSVILPIAGLILTYIFIKKIIDMLLEKNNMSSLEIIQLYKLFIETFLMILLITNSWEITLAFFDVGQHLVHQASGFTAAPGIAIDTSAIFEAIKIGIGNNFGTAVLMFITSLISYLVGVVAVVMIYIIAYSRIVMILIYISVAPLPFATLLNKDWIGGIGQNYLKNLGALAIQGFLMIVVLIIYSGISSEIISSMGSDPLQSMILISVSLWVCVKSLMSCLTLAKSIFQAH